MKHARPGGLRGEALAAGSRLEAPRPAGPLSSSPAEREPAAPGEAPAAPARGTAADRPAESAAGRERPADARPRRVLVVEDQAIIAMDIEDALTDLGYEVVATALDAEEAIALADLHRPDLVTMDINLGEGRDGVSAAIEIFERFRIRPLFVSAYGNAETRARAAQAHPLGWIPKPISQSFLKAALDGAGGGNP